MQHERHSHADLANHKELLINKINLCAVALLHVGRDWMFCARLAWLRLIKLDDRTLRRRFGSFQTKAYQLLSLCMGSITRSHHVHLVSARAK